MKELEKKRKLMKKREKLILKFIKSSGYAFNAEIFNHLIINECGLTRGKISALLKKMIDNNVLISKKVITKKGGFLTYKINNEEVEAREELDLNKLWPATCNNFPPVFVFDLRS